MESVNTNYTAMDNDVIRITSLHFSSDTMRHSTGVVVVINSQTDYRNVLTLENSAIECAILK